MAKAFRDAKHWLVEHIGPGKKAWRWNDVHVNDYPYQPWSLTPLKSFWHREAHTVGNGNSPGVSQYIMAKIEENKVIKSIHTANYKQVVQYGNTK